MKIGDGARGAALSRRTFLSSAQLQGSILFLVIRVSSQRSAAPRAAFDRIGT
jgi:hypothetical protein